MGRPIDRRRVPSFKTYVVVILAFLKVRHVVEASRIYRDLHAALVRVQYWTSRSLEHTYASARHLHSGLYESSDDDIPDLVDASDDELPEVVGIVD